MREEGGKAVNFVHPSGGAVGAWSKKGPNPLQMKMLNGEGGKRGTGHETERGEMRLEWIWKVDSRLAPKRPFRF